MKAHALVFTPDGNVRCLWTDAIPLGELGRLEVHRASTIEFNNEQQVWEAKVQGSLLFSHSSRAECLAWEHQHFNSTS